MASIAKAINRQASVSQQAASSADCGCCGRSRGCGVGTDVGALVESLRRCHLMTCRVRFGAALVPPTVVARARLHDARARSQPIGFAALSAKTAESYRTLR